MDLEKPHDSLKTKMTNNTNNSSHNNNYLNSLFQTPHRLRKRMLATWTPDQELNQVRQRSGADMKRKLKWHDLLALGLGGMLGVGVFVTTGEVAAKTGPAIFMSYLFAGVAALLSSLCYAEFAVQIPVAGGAFSYLRLTFGEFVGYLAGANILMEYVLSNAGAARSFTEYFSVIFGENQPNAWRLEIESHKIHLDFPAVALILLLTLCLCKSTKESSILNMVMTVFHVVFFGFIIIVGFCNGSPKNLVKPSGLVPFGPRRVVDGAAIVYFGYIGYDSASTLAEEIQNPSTTLPIGIVGSVLITTLIYCLMALSLCLMVPYTEIQKRASFSVAFESIGWKWGGNLVGAGASLGIVASVLVAMLGQARYLCVIGRARLVPSWLAKVHPSSGTPLNATLFLGICTATIALFTDLEIVLEMISIGTLVVFFLVANALIYRRYAITGKNPPSRVLAFLVLLSATSQCFSLTWNLGGPHWPWGPLLFGGSALTLIAVFNYIFVPDHGHDRDRGVFWSVPYMPWPPALSIFMNIFLISTLKMLSFQRFGIWTVLITLFYMLYGVHRTYEAEEIGTRGDRDLVQVNNNNNNNNDDVINFSSVQSTNNKLDNIQLQPVISHV